VLLQVVLNSQLAVDDGRFDVADVIHAINSKMRRRHPHVFGSVEEKRSRDKGEIRATWERIKTIEKSSETHLGVFKDHSAYPATIQALKIGKTARKINFDWEGPAPVFEKLLSEIEELKSEFKKSNLSKKTKNGLDAKSLQPSPALISEIGDVYFTLGQLCRHLDIDPEVTALGGNRKFLDRFAVLEKIARERKIDIKIAPQSTLEDLWQAAKRKSALRNPTRKR
jgi:MazG family protein